MGKLRQTYIPCQFMLICVYNANFVEFSFNAGNMHKLDSPYIVSVSREV